MNASWEDNCVVTYRGGVAENIHQIHVAITDSAGKLLHHVGNPHRNTLIRSAAKPLQALAVLETGGFKQHDLNDADLALMCASHNSEERHIQRARQMLLKVDAKETDLRCGGHPSIIADITRSWNQQGFEPTAIYNNCSGKHIGMLAGARAIGSSFKDYHLPEHPMQQRVTKVTEDLTDLRSDAICWGIDGCNMPAPAVPLQNLAKAYAYFGQAADLVASGVKSTDRIVLSASVFNAMVSYPDLVAGTGRFCSILMESMNGRVLGKVGADGCYGVSIRASRDTERLGTNGSVGIAVKVGDGNLDILYAAVSEILDRLAIGSVEARHKLKSFHYPSLKNTMGVVTGEVRFPFVIHEA